MVDKAYIPLFEKAAEMAAQTGAKYRDIGRDRDELLEFLDVNEWFGMEWSGNGVDRKVAPFTNAEKPLATWLLAYQQPPKIKLLVMLEAYASAFPDTCTLYGKFIAKKQAEDVKSGWQLLDYLLSTLDKDITDYGEEELRMLLDGTNGNLSASSRVLLMDFLEEGRNGQPISRWKYQIQKNESGTADNTAYTMECFSVMAYGIFNKEAWAEHSLVEKAAASKKSANLWLFTALHFVGAMRKSDLLRLPVPSLPYSPEALRQKILDGTFSVQEAAMIPKEVMFRLQIKPRKPHKTQSYSGIPDLKLFIPESLLAPMGAIMALALSFRETADPFVLPEQGIRSIQKFFGRAFAEAAGNKRFLTRRANKAYLQGIELMAPDEPGKPKGYMLAALARSHKGGIGRLPEITDIYLKDAAFSGYRPEFILREMFERGIFGFIPAMLLEAYSGKAYRKLDVGGQTQIIQAIGLNALQIENLAGLTEKSFLLAKKLVAQMVIPKGDDLERLGDVLQKIASGAAPSRQPECLCVRIAAGYACTCPERTSCIGCGYEIYTKAALHLVMKEYARLNSLRKEAANQDASRYDCILEKGLLPVITGMLSGMEALYPDAEMEPMLDIVERGMKYADSVECGGM